MIPRLAEQGVAILIISSELPEILGMSHRMRVMRGGRNLANIPRQDPTEESVMAAATGQALHSVTARTLAADHGFERRTVTRRP